MIVVNFLFLCPASWFVSFIIVSIIISISISISSSTGCGCGSGSGSGSRSSSSSTIVLLLTVNVWPVLEIIFHFPDGFNPQVKAVSGNFNC